MKNKPIFENPELSVEELSVALYNITQKLTQANLQLRESEKRRLEMFSNLSHDLRSPIATLRSYVEYLLSFNHLDENEVYSTLNLMNSKILLLAEMMDELLLINTLDSSTEDTVNFEIVQMGMYLEEFFYSCEADKKYDERELILNVPSHFPYSAAIDTKLFYRVLDNIFSNALKYSHPNDRIVLNASLSNKEILITISDTGIGIAQTDLAKIFDRTFMVSDARTPGFSNGCGLGLSIAHSIISKHNGRIWCESKLNEGSHFFIALPLVEA